MVYVEQRISPIIFMVYSKINAWISKELFVENHG
jgi:hypothetical protein